MNFNDLKTDFKTRYFTKNEPSSVFAGKPLFLLGEDISEYTGGIMTTLSAGTALTFNISENPSLFTIQNADTNIAYICEKKDLAYYGVDNAACNIFKKIYELQTQYNTPGLDMLFKNNTNNPDFFNYSDAISFAISCISDNYGKDISPPVVSAYHTLFFDECERKYSENPISFSGKKIIIITDDLKKQNIGEMCSSALDKLPEECNLCEQTISEKAFSIADHALLTFILNEKKRVESFKTEIDFNNVCNIISASGAELFALSNSDKLSTMQSILSLTESALAFRPTLSNSAVFVIVNDFAIDSFIKRVEEEYEKKAGSKPAFYICDIGSRHIIH